MLVTQAVVESFKSPSTKQLDCFTTRLGVCVTCFCARWCFKVHDQSLAGPFALLWSVWSCPVTTPERVSRELFLCTALSHHRQDFDTRCQCFKFHSEPVSRWLFTEVAEADTQLAACLCSKSARKPSTSRPPGCLVFLVRTTSLREYPKHLVEAFLTSLQKHASKHSAYA